MCTWLRRQGVELFGELTTRGMLMNKLMECNAVMACRRQSMINEVRAKLEEAGGAGLQDKHYGHTH